MQKILKLGSITLKTIAGTLGEKLQAENMRKSNK